MTSPVNTTNYADMGLTTHTAPTREIKKELGQSDFLALLTTQLASQDPLSPVDNKEFISQMSQFASLDSLQTLVNRFGELSNSLTSNQALQASALVGRNVLIEGNEGYLMNESVMAGQLNLDQTTTNIRFEIKDPAGQVIRSIEVGTQEAGDIDFIWDGNNNDGERMPPGNYIVAAYGQVGGSTEQLKTSMVARVESVNLGGSEGRILLNLTGLNQIDFNEVKEIG
ncbi:flagellar hook assembly protein FlgD [Aliikangiella maris]|uniref:Basal-body rod modification protein FlgD n=2 Tax=Aliikangiella maris TaxID=3162458 RepID=A0ABV2BSV9_9GAMM